MNIHLARDGSALGVFTEAEVREGLATGRFRPSDLAWREGMPAWTPLSSWPEYAGLLAAAAETVAPAGPAMPAWERGATFGNFFATIRDVAIDPVRTFDALPRGGAGRPLAFNYLAMLPGAACGAAVYGALASLGLLAALLGQGQELGEALGDGAFGAVSLGLVASCLALVFPLLLFVSAGLSHLTLLPWGPKGGYLGTYRVGAYTQGAFLLFLFIPCLNDVAVIWMTVCNVIGLSRVHRLEWWKVLISVVVIPCLLACCLVGFLALLIGAAGAHAGA